MGIGLSPKLDSLHLTRNATFVQSVELGQGKTFPLGTVAFIVVRDDAEIVLARFEGTVTGSTASFSQYDLDELNDIPHGAKFDLMLEYADGQVDKHSYGVVVRSENRYPLVASQVTTNYALQFSDTFDRSYVGKYWVPRIAFNQIFGGNSISIHDNSGSTPNTLGPNQALFSDASALWYTPMNSDSVTITASMVNAGSGKCTLIVCSDYSMTTWLGVQFETGLINNRLWVVRGNGPTTWTTLGTSVANTLTTGDNYVIKYNNQSRTIACYKNSSLSPVISYTDTNDAIPNGAGYRYTGIVWNASLLQIGAEPSSWSAKDGV